MKSSNENNRCVKKAFHLLFTNRFFELERSFCKKNCGTQRECRNETRETHGLMKNGGKFAIDFAGEKEK